MPFKLFFPYSFASWFRTDALPVYISVIWIVLLEGILSTTECNFSFPIFQSNVSVADETSFF